MRSIGVPKASPSSSASTSYETYKSYGLSILKKYPNIRHCVITLSSRGLILASSCGSSCHVPAPSINYVDGTGSGDIFRSSVAHNLLLAKRCHHGLKHEHAREACQKAVHVASGHCEYTGAELGFDLREKFRSPIEKGKGIEKEKGKEKEKEKKVEFTFASRLNSMKDMVPASSPPQTIQSMITRQSLASGLTHVDLNYPQHIDSATCYDDLRSHISKAGLKAGSVNMRYPREYVAGAFTNPSPALRSSAIALTNEACEAARKLGCGRVVVWSAYDGYDYPMCTDYGRRRRWLIEAFRSVCDSNPDIKVSLEYKPTDENTRFFIVPTTADAILVSREVGRDNFGLTLDFGHMIMSNENPGQSVSQVLSEGKLFGIHLNDGYSRYGAEDGLEFATVNYRMSFEVVYYLMKHEYSGCVYFDTFPNKVEPVEELERNIRTFERIARKVGEVRGMVEKNDGDWKSCREIFDKVNFV